MSFGTGRDRRTAEKDLGSKVSAKTLQTQALRSSQYLADSIHRTTTVKRLVYTSSIAALVPHWKDVVARPDIDETREPGNSKIGEAGYATAKRTAELFFAYQAALSGGRWSVIIANPSDIIGPVLSKHQAAETWQGKIAGIVQGTPSDQEPGGRPWMLVDARDVAEAEIWLAESSEVESGERFILTSGDKIYPEHIGPRVMELYPKYDCATTVLPPRPHKEVVRNEPFWIRANVRNDKIIRMVGFQFRSFDDTLRATVDSLVRVGAVAPKLR